jgi:thioredoxin 1
LKGKPVIGLKPSTLIVSALVVLITAAAGTGYAVKRNETIKSNKATFVKEELKVEVLHLTTNNFDSEVLQSDKPVLVDFWAAWCGPCRMVAPILEEIAQENGDSLKVGKVNVDEESVLASRYGIRSIPTLIIFKNGEKVDQIIGYVDKNALAAKLRPYLTK